jgi:glycosyltransferase involved in cell wall biosynthesis
MTKILFVHNTAMWYRRPLFKRLSEIYDVKFVFTNIQLAKDMYGMEQSEKIEKLEGLNYKILKNSFGSVMFELTKELLKNDYDVIVDSFFYRGSVISFIIAKLRSKQVIFWSGTWGWGDFKDDILNYKYLLKRYLLKHSNGIITYGTKSMDYFIKLGASRNKIFRAFNTSCINTIVDKKEVEELKRNLKVEHKKVIMYAGRLIKRKNADILIKAFYKLKQEHNDSCLIIIGDGECKNKFQGLCKKVNIENDVLFLGMIDNKDLPVYYSLCNLFVLPASGEPWGLVLNEAMQFGKPIIATKGVGAAYDLIKDGENGFMVPEKDSDALYEAMKTILSDSELEKKMGEESKKIIEKFTYENMVQGFREAIGYVIKRGEL